MSGFDVPNGMALICQTCQWRPAENLPIGLIAAHFETEHDTDAVTLELAVLCPRCDKPMAYERSYGLRDIFRCDPCRRTRTIRRSA